MPEEIHDVGADANVHGWLGKAMPAAEGEGAPLELAAGVVRVRAVGDREAQVFRLAQRGCELRLGKEAAEVDQRPAWARHGDAGLPRYFAGEEGAGSMHPDPLATLCLSRDGDVRNRRPGRGWGRACAAGLDAPESCRAGVAEHGLGPAGEHRRHPDALPAQSWMPNGVNPSMNTVQAPGPDSPVEALAADASAVELPT